EGEDLPGQRPDRDGTEDRRQAEGELVRTVGEPQPERGEEQVDQREVRVVPGAIGEDRPANRGAAPGGEGGEREQHPGPARCAADGQRHYERGEYAGAEPGQR